MKAINIHEAKTHFSKLVDRAMKGEEVTISKAGKPVVKLVPIINKREIHFGLLKAQIKISDDFDAPLPEDILKSFE